MTKKDETKKKGLVLTKEQEAIVKSFDPDDAEQFERLSSDEERIQLLDSILVGIKDSENKELDESVETTELSNSGDAEKNNIPMLFAGKIGLKKGTTHIAMFLGTVPLFSNKPKENWFMKKINGEKWYFNTAFLFQRTDGTQFQVADSPMLRPLKRVYTEYSYQKQVEAGVILKGSEKVTDINPIVKYLYHGKIEGKEQIAEMFPNFQLQKGEVVHGFTLTIDKKAVLSDRYSREIVNYVKNPIPNAKVASGEEEDMIDVANKSWSNKIANTQAQIESTANVH